MGLRPRHSDQRSAELLNWLHRYNCHRPHDRLHCLGLSEDNLLRLHSCATACILLYIAFGKRVKPHTAWRDFSYGTYLYAFPIQRMLMVLFSDALLFPIYFGEVVTMIEQTVLGLQSALIMTSPL
jgi:hypothetical protein